MTVPLLENLARDDHASCFRARFATRHERWTYWVASTGAHITALLLFAAMTAPEVALAESVPVFLAAPTMYTDVLDGFTGKGTPDFRLSLGFLSSTETSAIEQETRSNLQQGTRSPSTFANYERTSKQIWMSAEVGVYRDLMLIVSAPFVLEDARALQPTPRAVQSGLLDHAVGSDYDSRIRDGIPYVNAGLAYGMLNQFQTSELPTWIVRLDAQISTGEALTPCLHGQGCFRGASRGTTRLQGETRFSYRYRLVEPYCGFSYAREIVTTGEHNFWPRGKSANDLDQDPPTRAGWTAGLSVIPWENRGNMQRLTIDGRLSVMYVSRGRDYSPLFDVLGTSPLLTQNTLDTASNSTRFAGMTTVDAHVNMRGDVELLVRAAQYVRFGFGLGIATATTHFITGAVPCAGAADASGTCANDQVNPSYQSAIDRPGSRFVVTDIVGIDLSASAAGQF